MIMLAITSSDPCSILPPREKDIHSDAISGTELRRGQRDHIDTARNKRHEMKAIRLCRRGKTNAEVDGADGV